MLLSKLHGDHCLSSLLRFLKTICKADMNGFFFLSIMSQFLNPYWHIVNELQKRKSEENDGRRRNTRGNRNRLMPPPDCTIFGTSEHTNLFSVAREHWTNIRVMKWSHAINLRYAGRALIRTDGFTVYEHQSLWSEDEIENRRSLEQREKY